jgi:hypothetical protein
MCRHPRPQLVPAAVSPVSDTAFDPAEEMRRLAGRLLAAYEADPSNPGLAREARQTLLCLMGAGPAEDDQEWAEFVQELSTPDWPNPEGT